MLSARSYGFCFALLSVLILLSGGSCTRHAPESPAPFKEGADTLFTRAAALEAMPYHRDRALTIIDSAYIIGNISDFTADLLRMKVYCQTLDGMQLDSTLVIGTRLMEHDSVALDPRKRFSVLDLLVNASRLANDDEALLEWTSQKAGVCRELGEEMEALRTEVEEGAALTRLGHMDEGLEQIDNIISQLDGIRRFSEMDTWIIAIRRKINILQGLSGSSAQIAALSLRILSRLDDYSHDPDSYHDGSFREPDEDERPVYIDFYQAKCYAYLAEVYAGTDPREAERYLARLEQTDYGRTYDARIMMAPILCRLGQYDRMERIYREMDARWDPADTLSNSFLTMLHDRAVAAEAQGHASAALELWKRYDIIKGKIADKTISGKSILYAARYQSDKQRMALEEEQARRVRYYVLTWFLGGLALVFFLYILVAHFVRSRKEGEGEHKDAEKPPLAPAKRPASMDDVELFEYLSEVIRREQLFLNPLLDRQTLMTRMGVSAHRVGSAFSKGSAFGSLPGYIRHLRLEYACSLLVSRPDLSVKSVGEASGFSNNSTFCSDFKNCYGVTPSDFRQDRGERPF